MPRAQFQLPHGPVASAGSGSIIGRAWTADVRIDDGRVSEAHAMVSWRAGQLLLLPLRGRLRVDGVDVPRVVLREGQRVELAPGLSLSVAELSVPETVMAVRLAGGSVQVLAGVTSVHVAPRPMLESGYHPGASALLWSDGVQWRLQRPGLPLRGLRGGDVVDLGGVALEALDAPNESLGFAETRSRSVHGPRLNLTSRYESAQVWHDGGAPLVLKGLKARLLGELLALGGPARWEVVAAQLWRGEEDVAVLRHRLDTLISKLRRDLELAGVRRDLLFAHRNGQVELLLYPGDRVDEQA